MERIMTWRPGPPAADLDVHLGPGNAWPGAVVPISAGEFSLWNPPVINSDPCDSYHVICHMRERDNQWKLYMCLLYVFYNVYMYVPKNAKNTSQNNQCVCVCVGVAVVFANDICKHARKCPRLRRRVWQIQYYLHQGFGMQCYFQMT